MNSRIPYNHYFDEFVIRVMDEVGRIFASPLDKRFNLHTSRLPAHRVVNTDNQFQLSFWTDEVFYCFNRITVECDQEAKRMVGVQEQYTALIRENFAHYPHQELKAPRLTADKVQHVAAYIDARYDNLQDSLTGEQVFRLKKVVIPSTQ